MMCIVLRIIEGVAIALFTTAGYTLLTKLYPDHTGFIVVCENAIEVYLSVCTVMILFQGLAEIGSGLGFASGPVIGGFLYKVFTYEVSIKIMYVCFA